MTEQELYTLVFRDSLFSTLIVSMSAELYFYVLLLFGKYNALYLHLAATLAGVVGTVFNWAVGMGVVNFILSRQATFNPEKYLLLQDKFYKWGVWLLLLSWFSIWGMMIAFMAGMLRIKLRYLAPYVLIGMAGYYYAQIAYFEKYHEFLML